MCNFAYLLNRDCIEYHATNIITWSLIISYFKGFQLTKSDTMSANEPRSGNYYAQPGLWQFAGSG